MSDRVRAQCDAVVGDPGDGQGRVAERRRGGGDPARGDREDARRLEAAMSDDAYDSRFARCDGEAQPNPESRIGLPLDEPRLPASAAPLAPALAHCLDELGARGAARP